MRTFKVKGIEMVLKCAAERNDEETIVKMQAVLGGEGQLAAVTLHKSCYGSYTSKHNIQKHTAHKRKAESNLVEEQPSSRIRRSQIDRFDFMSQCLFCGHLCQSMNTKHPERWDRVVQCERKGVKGASAFKDSGLRCCIQRNDEWSKGVSLRCHTVLDLSAAEARYHVRCYDKFRKVPIQTEKTNLLSDDYPLAKLVDEMNKNRDHNTWTSTELMPNM